MLWQAVEKHAAVPGSKRKSSSTRCNYDIDEAKAKLSKVCTWPLPLNDTGSLSKVALSSVALPPSLAVILYEGALQLTMEHP